MGLPLYLAGTRGEMPEADTAFPAYMACHFSPYENGLEAQQPLPRCSMVILNDRVPVWGHDPDRVAAQLWEVLEQAEATCVLLDLQRPGCPEAMVKALAALPCPVGVTEGYAQLTDGPVLAEVPMHRPLEDARKRWNDRELWLDVAANVQQITVTGSGSCLDSLPPFSPEGIVHREARLCCSYCIDVSADRAVFTLFRTREDIEQLLRQAEELGFTGAVGLYQELHGL